MSAFDDRIAAVIAEAAGRVPAFAARLAEAGLSAEDVRGVADLDRIPVLSKDELVTLQRSEPPFGGMLAPGTVVPRLFCSPGPLYEPQLAGPDPWRWQQALRAAGFTEGDVVLNCFGYHLSPAGAMFDEAARALGATVVPGGVGNLDVQAEAVADLGVTAFTGLPSYLDTLIERYREAGHPAGRWKLSKALVTAEPLPPELRARLTEHVEVVRMAYGTAETGLLGYEHAPQAGLTVPGDVLVQLCDLDTGRPVTEGEGQVVITLLRAEYPLVRFGTGDLSAWRSGENGEDRLAGVLGRVGEAVKVRGMFLHPRQIESAMRGIDGLLGYRFLVDRVGHRDELSCELRTAPGVSTEQVTATAAERITQALRLRARVEVVGDGSGSADGVADGEHGPTLIDRRGG